MVLVTRALQQFRLRAPAQCVKHSTRSVRSHVSVRERREAVRLRRGFQARSNSRVLLCASAGANLPSFRILRVAGDGNCLFRSIVQSHHASLYSNGDGNVTPLSPQEEEAKAMALRGEICAELVRQKAFVEPFIGIDVEEYVREMQKPSTWGGEPELSMASTVLGCPVIVFEPSMQGTSVSLSKISEYSPLNAQVGDRKSIHVLFSRGMHYDALITMP